MPRNDKSAKAHQSTARRKSEFTRAKLVQEDPREILERAQKKPVRVSARHGGRDYHLSTIRHGTADDPAARASVLVTVAALKRHGTRILYLASALQIALRIEHGKDDADAFFIEPGRDSSAFALARLGGPIEDVASFARVLRHSRIAQAAADAAAKQFAARGRDEIDALNRRIGALNRSLKNQSALAAKYEKGNAALRKAQSDRAAAATAATQVEAQRRDEIGQLKSRIKVLERSLKRRAALDRERNDGSSATHTAPEDALPAGSTENGSIAVQAS